MRHKNSRKTVAKKRRTGGTCPLFILITSKLPHSVPYKRNGTLWVPPMVLDHNYFTVLSYLKINKKGEGVWD